ncbi:MAG: hypothetical protein R3E96_12480 [Planctomycetota bacterium]
MLDNVFEKADVHPASPPLAGSDPDFALMALTSPADGKPDAGTGRLQPQVPGRKRFEDAILLILPPRAVVSHGQQVVGAILVGC